MSSKIIDIRSDTVTLPTPAMRQAIYEAELGDDVFGEDPTVNRLEALAAEMLGKEAGLFVASGTMGNLVSIVTHCQRGDEVIVGDQAHCFFYEVGGAAVVGGLSWHCLPNGDGLPDPAAVENAIRPENIHTPRTGLICLENTHNRCGGVALSSKQMQPIVEIARRHRIPLHLDGARIFNAAIATGEPARELAAPFDSVQFCLSKGLSCPVGSLVVGNRDFIERARKLRKMLGGGMRQAGVLAAAGLVALTTMIDRLAEDHVHARLLAEGMAQISGLVVDLSRVQTNIVVFEVLSLPPAEFVANLAKQGVRVIPFGGRRCRAVTHYGIEREDILTALDAMRRAVQQ
ncbi:MAG: low-specificity L-threonine aldolase [Candidatus Tectomicrobia bacterium]|uniref:Low-specificity L-threonine aldolase n=1 Tax=Tectimicrobiota bacterium TaxID=2528274 RepID=A0A932CQ82_UNCTE|nr:low-specificity L-threonine aldolase [Candidatus Tectomicrobia bacterium]